MHDLVLGDSVKKKTIRFDSMKMFIVSFCVKPFASPFTMASSTIAMLILFVVSTFFVHINRNVECMLVFSPRSRPY